MKHIVHLLCLLFMLNVSGQTLSVNQLHEDFDYLRSALEEAHGGLYRHYPKSQIDHLFDRSRSALKRPMNQLSYYGFLSRLLAGIGDGHMKLTYAGTPPNPYLFPFRILAEKDKAFILSNDTKTDTVIKPGMRLLHINDRSFADIKRTVLPFVIGEGHIQTGKEGSLQRNFSQLYKIFVDTSAVFLVKARDANGRLHTVNIHGVKNVDREINRSQNPVNAKVMALTTRLEDNSGNVSLRFINDSIASLRIKYFIGDRFRQEIDSLFALISKRNSKALILDIRGNGGGLDEYGAYTAAKFATKPFRYIDKVHARF